jgi:hypothetical protein
MGIAKKKESKKACGSMKKSIQKSITEYYFPKKEKQGNDAQRKQILKKDNFKCRKNIKDMRCVKKENLPGFTYLLGNHCQPFQTKIGIHFATDDFQNRVNKLNNTSVATDFKPICVIKTNCCSEIEKKLHHRFRSHRVGGEFFGYLVDGSTTSCDFDRIKKKYQKLVNRIVKWMCLYAIKYDGEIIM